MDRLQNGTVAIFDFDGTLTASDTFRDILIWRFGKARVFAMLAATSFLIALYMAGLVSNDFPKVTLFRKFFRGWPIEKFEKLCSDYAQDRLPTLIRAEALERARWHQSQGHMVVVASASLKDWIEPWARTMNIEHVFAVRAAQSDGYLTGDFEGPCLYGREKADAIRRSGFTREKYELFAYGDSRGDKEMLAMADHPAFRRFRP